MVDRRRRARAEGYCPVSRVGAGGVRSRATGTRHPVQRAAGGRVHDRGADRAEGLARDAADHRSPGAWDRRVRCSPRAGTAQRASGLRIPIHESVGAGDGWSRLHERDRAGRWPGGVAVRRVGICRTRALRPGARGAPWATGSDQLSRRVRSHAGAGDQLSCHGARLHRLPGNTRLHRSGAAGRRRRRCVPDHGIRCRHCIGADGPSRAAGCTFHCFAAAPTCWRIPVCGLV